MARRAWRPCALSKEWLLVADEILSWDKVVRKGEVVKENEEGKEVTTQEEKTYDINEYRAIFLSDEEMLFLINERLEELNQWDKIFHERTFQRYKRKFVNKQDDEKLDKEEPIPNMDKDYFESFCRLIKKHLIKQKQKLFQAMVSAPKDRQKYAWIIERKFDEWNIRNKQETFQRDTPFVKEDNIYDEEYEDTP